MFSCGNLRIYEHWISDLRGSIIRIDDITGSNTASKNTIVTFITVEMLSVMIGAIRSVIDSHIADHSNATECANQSVYKKLSTQFDVYLIAEICPTEKESDEVQYIIGFEIPGQMKIGTSSPISKFKVDMLCCHMSTLLESHLIESKILDQSY